MEKSTRSFEKLSKKLENLSKEIEEIVPKAVIKKTSNFGNSSHVVLSKSFLDKKVGIIILEENAKMKGGKKWVIILKFH